MNVRQILYPLSRIWRVIVLTSFFHLQLQSQNLVPNHSFEVMAQCPFELGDPSGGPLDAVPWMAHYSANNFHACADPMYCGVPENFLGVQTAFDGVAYAGGYFDSYSGASHEFVYTMLLDTLEIDKCYKVSCWLSLADEGCGCDQAGIRLTADEPTQFTGADPTIAWGGSFLSDKEEWMSLLGYHISNGTELYITIGNFVPHAGTHGDPECWGPPAFCYYYIDYVEVIELPIEQVEVDLGPPVTVCDSFIIDPGGDPDVVYNWSTGHQGHTLTVYTTGVYSVTASYACTTAEGDIEVTVLHPQQVEIGPDTAIICQGEIYEISLDPGLGAYTWQDGSDDTEYAITTGGMYSVTLDDGCTLTSDTILVMTMDVPLTFTLGEDTTLCPGDEFIIQFDPTLGDFEWQDGSEDPSLTIDDDGTYALTISNMCGEQTDELEVEGLQPPVINIGPDTTIRCGTQIIDLDFDPEMGTYLWQDGNTNSYYTISAPGLYSVTVTNQCGSDADMMYVDYQTMPAIFLGPDLQGCPGDTIILSAGNNEGQFVWEDGSTGFTHTVTTTGLYGVTITNGCGMASDQISITFSPMIFPPDLGPDINLCPGDEVTLGVDIPGAQYLWNDMSTSDSLLVNTPGTYFVQVYNLCASYTDTVNVSLTSDPPALQLPADFDLCAGQTISLDPGLTGVSYLWNDGSLLPSLTVSNPGTYALTVSNACGMSVDTVIISAGDALPTVDLGPDTSLCQGDTILLIPTFSAVSSWLWHDGSTQPFYQATMSEVISVAVANTCATTHDTINISLLPATPSFDLGPDTMICPGETIILTISTPGVSIVWPDGSGGTEYVVQDSTLVIATISNVCGQNNDSINVGLLASTPALNLGEDQTICPGDQVTLTPGIADVSYLWHDGSMDTFYLTTLGDTIHLTIADGCGMSSDTIILTESTHGPQVNLGPDIIACEGESIVIPAGIAGVMYEWQDGSSANELTVSSPGMYSLTVSNSCGIDADSVLVDFIPLPPVQYLGQDTMLCEGLPVILHAVVVPGVDVLWQDGSALNDYVVNSAGVYAVMVSNLCGQTSDTLMVDYIDAPDPFYLGPDTSLCPGETILLSSPSIFYDVLWQDGSGMLHLVADHAGTYWLQLSNACGSEADTLIIDVNTEWPVLTLEPHWLWCPGDQFVLEATQSFGADYLWSTGETSSCITVTSPGIYSVEVSSVCKTEIDQSEVLEDEDCPDGPVFYIPNVFSPNDDGVNDIFTVLSDMPDMVLEMKGTIYDRWGNVVFSEETLSFEWNGLFDDEKLNPGVFVYLIEIRYIAPDGERTKTFAGDVTLIR